MIDHLLSSNYAIFTPSAYNYPLARSPFRFPFVPCTAAAPKVRQPFRLPQVSPSPCSGSECLRSRERYAHWRARTEVSSPTHSGSSSNPRCLPTDRDGTSIPRSPPDYQWHPVDAAHRRSLAGSAVALRPQANRCRRLLSLAQGGPDALDNAIVICLECPGEARHHNSSHRSATSITQGSCADTEMSGGRGAGRIPIYHYPQRNTSRTGSLLSEAPGGARLR